MAKTINYPYGVKSIILENNGGGAGGDVYLDGNSLVIPEQEGPQPVITIDNVAYYHKQEFNLEELELNTCYDLISTETGTTEGNTPATASILPSITKFNYAAPIYPTSELVLKNETGYRFILHANHEYSSDPQFTSRAFTVVDTQEEVTDNTKICLPTCSAYYGFLSEDGNTFISYYNLKSDGAAPEYVDSIKQGNAVIPLKDTRVPDSAIADAGKVVKVGEDGSYELGEAGGGGTALYSHLIIMSITYAFDSVQTLAAQQIQFHILTNRQAAFTSSNNDLYYIGFLMQNGSYLIGSTFMMINTTFYPKVVGGETQIGSRYSTTSASNFLPNGILYIKSNYPGATPSIEAYGPDTIDLSTGEVAARVNKGSNLVIVSFEDTVTTI